MAILTTMVLVVRLFATGGLIIFLLCRPASCLARRPPPPSNDDKYYCDWCPRHSTASAADLDALLRGGNSGSACGYGAAELDGGAPHVAGAGADFFFRHGAGCGACYQLRCRDRRVCSDDGGVKVVVVAGAANRTGFVLTREAFAAMARRPAMSSDSDQLLPAGFGGNNVVVQVDFRRIPCEYENRNLSVRIEEGSRRRPTPARLAISFLYQGGQTDIAAVEIARAASASASAADGATAPAPPSWRPMARVRSRRGVVTWRTSRAPAPAGPLQLRLVVTAGVGGKWLRAGGEDVPVLPADWRPGQVYDTGLRVRDVALSTCARSCRASRRPRPLVVVGGEELR